MSAKKKKGGARSGRTLTSRAARELEGGVGGAVTGAALGAAGGPPGIVVGAIVGAAAGTVTAAALDTESSKRSDRTRELDNAIGVTAGSLGAPNLSHPPAKVGAYSASSAGAASSSSQPAEGPFQIPED